MRVTSGKDSRGASSGASGGIRGAPGGLRDTSKDLSGFQGHSRGSSEEYQEISGFQEGLMGFRGYYELLGKLLRPQVVFQGCFKVSQRNPGKFQRVSEEFQGVLEEVASYSLRIVCHSLIRR